MRSAPSVPAAAVHGFLEVISIAVRIVFSVLGKVALVLMALGGGKVLVTGSAAIAKFMNKKSLFCMPFGSPLSLVRVAVVGAAATQDGSVRVVGWNVKERVINTSGDLYLRKRVMMMRHGGGSVRVIARAARGCAWGAGGIVPRVCGGSRA